MPTAGIVPKKALGAAETLCASASIGTMPTSIQSVLVSRILPALLASMYRRYKDTDHHYCAAARLEVYSCTLGSKVFREEQSLALLAAPSPSHRTVKRT